MNRRFRQKIKPVNEVSSDSAVELLNNNDSYETSYHCHPYGKLDGTLNAISRPVIAFGTEIAGCGFLASMLLYIHSKPTRNDTYSCKKQNLAPKIYAGTS